MSTIKRILCLANSRKLQGRCIAGKVLSDAVPAEWIRPVSERENQEVSEQERQYEDGSDPRVLDIIDVPMIKPTPSQHQPENWLFDATKYWVKKGQAGHDFLQSCVDPVTNLWINGHSTYNGKNDKIPLEAANSFDDSLRLIHVDSLSISVCKPGEAFGNPKRRVQGHFQHCSTDYELWITDPNYERTYLAKPDGDYKIGESYLTISLGEPYKNAFSKLIATVIEC